MPRLPRIYLEGALYYVVAEAGQNIGLFKDNADYSTYLALVNKYKSQYQFKLFSFVLMSNQVNMLIETLPDTTFSQIMHDINSAYTKYFNGRYERSGHLFKERFRAILIEKENYLSGVTRFMHLLPVDTHLVKQPGDYHWSSYQAYLSNLTSNCATDKLIMSIGPEQMGMDIKEVLDNFSKELDKARLMYQEFVEKAEKKEIDLYKNKLYRASVVGTAAFIEKVIQISKTASTDVEETQADEGIAPVPKKNRTNQLVYVLVVFILIFLGINSFLLKGNVNLKKEIKEVALEKDELFTKDLLATKQELSRELEEKYRADMVSYKVTAMRLQEMNKRVKEKGEKL
ncbi:MAG: transposase [Candidatus Omnitrophota bacterium]